MSLGDNKPLQILTHGAEDQLSLSISARIEHIVQIAKPIETWGHHSEAGRSAYLSVDKFAAENTASTNPDALKRGTDSELAFAGDSMISQYNVVMGQPLLGKSFSLGKFIAQHREA
ncbi:hypothetical protein D3P06_10580 [Paracoccus aestuarii]|uniref:Uncharacterized protein n=1 Tax=Paracoccus aestuarii TaxID=453842 RepID=A0A418ZUL2_9RHOB|nr:hypothetical protein D3P06_10580 [Paracoccus aestuarii]